MIFRRLPPKRELVERLAAMQERNETMHIQLAAMADILSARDVLKAFPDTATGTGNKYRTYSAQVNQLAKMFNGQAQWGNDLVENIVKVRAAFIIGGGVMAVPTAAGADRLEHLKAQDGEATLPELEFARAFYAFNDIDRECAKDFVNEGELEGKALLILAWDEEARMPSVRHVSWTATRYEIHVDAGDYKEFTRATWRTQESEGDLAPEQFVYVKLGGRTSAVNDTPPRLGKSIQRIENLDQALADWRKINKLYGAPTPYIKTGTKEEAKEVLDMVALMNWKVGKFLAGTGEFSVVGYEGGNIESIEKEIITNAKILSGNIGVPVHFLGLPDVLSNRAVADNLMELITASTLFERDVWTGGHTELLRKAIRMKNLMDPAALALDPDAVEAAIPFVTEKQMREIALVWLPLYEAEGLSLATLLSKLPEVDPEEELDRILGDRERREHSLLSRAPVTPRERDDAPESVDLGDPTRAGTGGNNGDGGAA